MNVTLLVYQCSINEKTMSKSVVYVLE